MKRKMAISMIISVMLVLALLLAGCAEPSPSAETPPPVKTSPPEAGFSANPTSGTAPLTVEFTDQSTGEITYWSWDFDKDGNRDSSNQNPSYTYETSGTYTISLKVIGSGGSDTETKTDYITVAAPPPIGSKGAILLATRKGVSIVEDGDWKSLDISAGLPHNLVEAMTIDDQERIWLAHSNELSVLSEEGWTHYKGDVFDYHTIGAVACDDTGRIWVGCQDSFYVLESGEWKSYDIVDFGLGEEASVRDIAIDAGRQVWVATKAGVSMFDGSKWTPYGETSGLASRYTEAIAVDQDGKICVAHSNGVSIFDGSNWTNYGSTGADFEVQALSGARDIAVDKQGRIWVVTFSRGVSVFDGDHWETYTRENSGLIGGWGRAIACDAQGRVWVGTDWEATVFDGSQWLTYTQATSGLVANQIFSILCYRAGPSSLPLPHGSRAGSASGKVLRQSAPLAGAEVNIAWDVSTIFSGPTPCKGDVYKATTDDEGRFSIADIPIGVYEYAIYIPEDNKWYAVTSYGTPVEIHIISGENTDIGEINFKE